MTDKMSFKIYYYTGHIEKCGKVTACQKCMKSVVKVLNIHYYANVLFISVSGCGSECGW